MITRLRLIRKWDLSHNRTHYMMKIVNGELRDAIDRQYHVTGVHPTKILCSDPNVISCSYHVLDNALHIVTEKKLEAEQVEMDLSIPI